MSPGSLACSVNTNAGKRTYDRLQMAHYRTTWTTESMSWKMLCRWFCRYSELRRKSCVTVAVYSRDQRSQVSGISLIWIICSEMKMSQLLLLETISDTQVCITGRKTIKFATVTKRIIVHFVRGLISSLTISTMGPNVCSGKSLFSLCWMVAHSHCFLC